MAEEETFDDEDLGGDEPEERNWKGIIIAVLVICFVIGMIITSVMLLTPPDKGPRIKGERMAMDQLLRGDFDIKPFNGTWISNLELAILDPSGGLSAFNVQEMSSRLLVSNITFRQLKVDNYSVSADHQWVLLAEHIRGVSKHDDMSQYHLYEVASQHHTMLTPNPELRRHPGLRLAEWSPVGSALVLVDENYDILYMPSMSSQEVIPITTTGEPGVITNGVANWLYEEEVLQNRKAVWFSPSGSQIVYAEFNDSLVDEIPISRFGINANYPELTLLRYPKPGGRNPRFTLWVTDLTDLNNRSYKDIKPPDGLKDSLDYYFTAVNWVSETKICVVWMNRPQNTSIITTCSAPLYFCETIHTEHSQHSWIDIYDSPVFHSDGQSFLVRLPVRDGEFGNFQHVNLYDVNMRRVTPMTHGPFVVTKILGWNERNDTVYYIATREGEPGVRHLYRIPFNMLSPLLRQPECLSCLDFDENETNSCLYNDAHLSAEFDYFVLECKGPGLPRSYLFSTENPTSPLIELNDYGELRDLVENTAMPQIMNLEVELENKESATARVKLYLPPGLREDEITTYPMVVDVDASPGGQAVNYELSYDFGSYLASQKDIIYARIDGRGTGFAGDKMKHQVYHILGIKEVEDQLSVINYLKENLHFIDKERIAMWGRQYGAFVTLMSMAKDAEELIRCGVAIAPIVRWEQYDSVYSERYMGSPHILPGSNYKGYEAADVTKVVGNLKEKNLMLIHGTADHTVPYHHSMMLSKALTDEGILFRQMTYSDEGHDLWGVTEHFYTTLETFLSDCFRPSVEEIYWHIKKKKEISEIGYL